MKKVMDIVYGIGATTLSGKVVSLKAQNKNKDVGTDSCRLRLDA